MTYSIITVALIVFGFATGFAALTALAVAWLVWRRGKISSATMGQS